MIRKRSMVLFACGLLCLPALATGQDWNLQIVDDAGDAGYDSQIAVTSDGTPYIFYKTGGTLYLAWWVPGDGNEGGWQYSQLDSGLGNGYSFEVLVDPEDHLHVAYGRYSSPGAKYGIYDPVSASWILGPETITGAPTYCYVDLFLASIGPDLVPCVPINRDGEPVRVYVRDPGTGTWTSTLVDAVHNAGHGASVAVDSDGDMHVSFYENNGRNLMYATKAWTDTVWQVSTVDVEGNVGDYSSLLVDASDVVHIVYYDATNGDLKYASLSP